MNGKQAKKSRNLMRDIEKKTKSNIDALKKVMEHDKARTIAEFNFYLRTRPFKERLKFAWQLLFKEWQFNVKQYFTSKEKGISE